MLTSTCFALGYIKFHDSYYLYYNIYHKGDKPTLCLGLNPAYGFPRELDLDQGDRSGTSGHGPGCGGGAQVAAGQVASGLLRAVAQPCLTAATNGHVPSWP